MTRVKNRLNFAAAAAAVAIFALAACQERTPSGGPVPSASSSEYPNPSEAPPASTGAAVSSESKVDSRK